LLWNNASQTSATEILVSHLDDEGTDIELFLSFFAQGQKIFIQNRDDSSQNQVWEITGTPTVTNPNTSTAYYTFPVTVVSSAGLPFTNNHSILFGSIAAAVNAVTSATTSDGTASLNISNLTLSQAITSGLQTKMTFTAQPTTYGDGQQIIWQWYNGGSPITTAAISSVATGSTSDKLVFKTSSDGILETSFDLTNTLATFSGSISSLGESYRSTSTFTYAAGVAATHRTALGLTTLATTTPAANVVTFLATPTSANLAAAVTDETGTGALVFGTSPTIDAPTISGSAAFTSTTRPTSAGTGTPSATSLITRADFDQRIITGMLNMWAWPVQGTTFTNVLGIGDLNGGVSLFCGAIAASSLARLTGASQPPYASLGTAGLINWASPIYFSFIAYSGAIASSGINRVYLGLPHSITTVQDLNVKGVGIKTIGSSIFFQVFGTSLVTSASSVGTLTSLAQSFLITGDGTGTYNLFINGVLASTLSGGPTGTSSDRSIQAMCSTSDTFPHRLVVNGAKLWL